MLNPKVAEERLKEFAVTESETLKEIEQLPENARTAAFGLLGRDAKGVRFLDAQSNYGNEWHKRYDKQNKAKEDGYNHLNGLSESERETFFAAFFPRMAKLLSQWWKPKGVVLYQNGYNRRPFRIPGGGEMAESLQERRGIFEMLLGSFTYYREMPVAWFAAWTPYLGAYQADMFGRLFAFAIDHAGKEGDDVFDILMESAKGEHEIGAMGRHVTRGLLSASRPAGWDYMEKTLIAAQRQEGLRQSILEVIDEAHPQAFRRMLKLIRENDLFRFSATVRAADVWFGMNWVAYEKLSVKQANAATETVETFLTDPAGRDEVLATTTDGQTVYLALWSMAFDDASKAMDAAIPLLADPQVERRYAALHLLTELRLPIANAAILSAFDDPDLRIAQKAFDASNWYGGNFDSEAMRQYAEHLAVHDQTIVFTLTESENALNEATAEAQPALQPGNPLATLLNNLQEAFQGTVNLIKDGVTKTKPNSPAVQDDRFERLERNIPRFPVREQELEPVIWEWDKQKAHAERLADALPRLIEDRPIERLFPYIKQMSSYGRGNVCQSITARPDKTPEMREVLFELIGDTQSYVRDAAFKAIENFTLSDDEATRVESLLTRKSADLRKASINLLLRLPDEKALATGENLTSSKDANQRLAGLDLLTQMVEKKREPEKARKIVTGFQSARGEKITAAEKAMVEPLTSATHEKATLENALGLLDKSKMTVGAAPIAPNPAPDLVGTASEPILTALNALIEQHKENEVKSPYDSDTYLLGQRPYWFPHPQNNTPLEEDLQRLPLREVWEDFWKNRPDTMRDADGRELLRAGIALAKASEKKYEHSNIMSALLYWFARLSPERDPSVDTEFYLQTAEYAVATIPAEKRGTEAHGGDKGHGLDWRDGSQGGWVNLARRHAQTHPTAWNREQVHRLWNLMCYVAQPYPAAVRRRIALDEALLAYRHGAASDMDLYDHLLGERIRVDKWSGEQFNDLSNVSGRKAPQLETTPGLREIVDNCRARILEVELRRGDTETAASKPALALRYTGGRETLFKTVAALGKETFARGYSYYGQTNRSNVFSRLVRATFPGDEDTFEAFADAAKAAKITDKRLLEVGMYAPQWAKHVEYALGWDSLYEAIWWFHAHTKGNDWSVGAELKEAWTAEIADKTPLSASDLTEGAVDVAWFQRVYTALGESRWKMLDDAAKFASSAGGHKRAQLFADAMRGLVSRTELLARITDKRNQDALRALGLLPFSDDPEEKDTDLLTRYKAMQEFLRTSKQFGAQRQESEKLASRIGMENLARTAGYADPIRLTWAMEAAAVADLKDGPVTATVGETSVSLAIDGLGQPEITVVKKGKVLANIPPAVKKDPDVATLTARKTEIARQLSRMRESLETAMCRGDQFTGAELETLLDHPVLRPLLRNLVFIEAEGNEPVSGYPIGDNRLEDCDGNTFTLADTTALRIAHPYDLLHTDKWDRWQKDCFLRERVQPFKQVFRELYVLTEAEMVDTTRSRRYTGHQVNPKQALALFNKRGWIGGGEYDYEGEGPRKTFHEVGLTASVNFMGWTLTPADVEGSTIEEVRFTKKGEWKSVELASVPPRIFSEAMRDLDLVVSVAHVGGVDPEASQSTVEMRAALAREMMNLLKITNVRIEKSHALIDGALSTYSVHLGSGVVHRQPGGYLCIVPVHSQHRGRLFLPFVDDDPRTAEVISKIMLLAKDNEIKDPTILEQILRVK